MSYGYRYPAEANGFSLAAIITFLHPYWTGLKRFWWIPAIVAAMAGGGMLLKIKNQPPAPFSSTARMWISMRSALDAGSARANEEAGETQIEVMRSRQMLEAAANRVQAENPTLRVTPVSFGVTQVKNTAIYQLQAVGADAEYTRKFLDVFINEYLNYLRKTYGQGVDKTVDTIRESIQSIGRELGEKQKKLAEFQDTHSIQLLKERTASSTGLFGQLDGQNLALERELHLLQSLSVEQLMDRDRRNPSAPKSVSSSAASSLTKPVPENPDTMASGITAGVLGGIYDTRYAIDLMKYELEELSVFLKPKHPKIKDLLESIGRAQKSLEVHISQSRDQIEDRKKAITLEMKALEEPIKKAQDEALAADQLLAQFDALKGEVAALRPMLEQLQSAERNVLLRGSMTDYSLNILEPPSPAGTVPRQNTRNMIMAVAVGLVVGIGIVALIVFFDDRVKSLTALKSSFQEPIIGQIPNIQPSADGGVVDLIMEDDDRHNYAESYRNIRSSILFMEVGETRPKTIVITSAIPEEGKSSVAANLAKTMAMSGSKVLLVDGDQRRCSLNEKLKLPVEPGFSDVLTGKMPFDQAVQTPFPNLFFLARGTSMKNPGEQFIGPAANSFLRSVYDQFDYILIDTPPVLAADDTTSLAPKVDGVIFVVRAEYTSSRLAKQSLELLYNRHVRVLGLVYNRANLFLPEYSYYKYASYYQSSNKAES